MLKNYRMMLITLIFGPLLAACGSSGDGTNNQRDVNNTSASEIEVDSGQSEFNSAGSGFVSNARLPLDVKLSCTANVASWFVGGIVSSDGWVTPANSEAAIFADPTNNTRCDFYKWGAQMFLWLTSEEGDQHVFNSAPGFYNVSVSNDDKRYFLPENGPMLLGVRKSKTDNEIELGQAGDNDVLISQENSLVYYGLHANNVYALFATATRNGASGMPSSFPSTMAEVEAVSAYASSYGYPLQNTQAMAIELKTSWIDAATLSDTKNYVLSQALVPAFDRAAMDPNTGKQQWTVAGSEEKTLALVGMHIVGTVNGHPEMVWTTIEHVKNVPDATYSYTTNTGGVGNQGFDSSGSWHFLPANAAEPTSLVSDAIVSSYEGGSCVGEQPADASLCIVNAVAGTAITPLDVIRVDPWGDKQSDSGVIDNNTDLASINVSVLSQLGAGDARGNYIQTGGIWTVDGKIPPGYPTTLPANLRGSLHLANTTMETFYQFPNDTFNPVNCFGCHGTTSTTGTNISHIFDEMQALPKIQQ